jgi:hypothetical protein
MTKGLEIRAQIDTENVKGLLIVNGGAAIALLAFLPGILDRPGYEPLARAIFWGLLIFQVGLLFGIFHNRLRRICSLRYEQHNYQPPPCEVFGIKLAEPCVCRGSIICMWLSVAAFAAGGLTVFQGGLESLDHRAKLVEKPKVMAPQNAEVQSNPTVERDECESSARPSP